MAGLLNRQGYNNLILSDDFSRPDKAANYASKEYRLLIDRKELPAWIAENEKEIECILHLGARTDTTLHDVALFNQLNLHYSQALWQQAVEYQIPFIYASSAATYGNGDHGYDDANTRLADLQPMNPYGWSKHQFDLWVQAQETKPFFWAGFKFFNVYGPNEYHKGRMASVIFHSFNQIKNTGKVRLFKSHRPDYADGGQSRDFIYVKDLCQVLLFFMENRPKSGLYNLGTGQARPFSALASATFQAMGIPTSIEYIDTPEDIRENYQYFTQATVAKLREAGYEQPFVTLEEGIADYVTNYLQKGEYY